MLSIEVIFALAERAEEAVQEAFQRAAAAASRERRASRAINMAGFGGMGFGSPADATPGRLKLK